MDEPCELCGGTGQRCRFKGESRFLLSWDECPACCGTGCRLDATAPIEPVPPNNEERSLQGAPSPEEEGEDA